MQFKTHDLFISGIFQLIFLYHRPWKTYTVEIGVTDKGTTVVCLWMASRPHLASI